MAIIEVKNLVKKYKKAQSNAVNDISFNVKAGEFFAFLGPNGAGKTTSISILTTILSKTSGSITIDGLDIDKDSSLIRQRVGIIFQKPSIDLNLTAEENIRFHTILYGQYPFRPTFSSMPSSYKDKLIELSTIIGLKDEIFKPVKQFSGGMMRKLEIIRSLMHSPKILFLDEPTTGLDPESRRNLWDYIKTVKNTSGTTIFLTTHYLDEVEDADTVCIINKGIIVANASPEVIKSKIVKDYVFIHFNPTDRQKLEDQIKNLNYNYEISLEGLKVFISDYSEIKNLINGITVPVLNFEFHKPSLEDAYLRIIKDNIDI